MKQRWSEIEERRSGIMEKRGRFITDFGSNLPIRDGKTGLPDGVMPRFAVWGECGRGKDEVIEISTSLRWLKDRYGEDLGFYRIGGERK